MSNNPKHRKNGGKGTFFGNLLRGVVKTGKNVGAPLLDAITGGNVSNIIGAINGDSAFTEAEKSMLIKQLEIDAEDLKDARSLQKEALKQDDLFSKRFIYYLASGVFIFSATIVVLLFFKDIPEQNKDVVNFILGVVVGTGLTGIFQYFFGSSKGSKDKQEFMTLLNKK